MVNNSLQLSQEKQEVAEELLGVVSSLIETKQDARIRQLEGERDYWRSEYTKLHKIFDDNTTTSEPSSEIDELCTKIHTLLEQQSVINSTSNLNEKLRAFEKNNEQAISLLKTFSEIQRREVDKVREHSNKVAAKFAKELQQYKDLVHKKSKEIESFQLSLNEVLRQLATMLKNRDNQSKIVTQGKIDELELENKSLKLKIVYQQEQIQQLEEEVKKWKDISLLTIPLVELANLGLNRAATLPPISPMKRKSIQLSPEKMQRTPSPTRHRPEIRLSSSRSRERSKSLSRQSTRSPKSDRAKSAGARNAVLRKSLSFSKPAIVELKREIVSNPQPDFFPQVVMSVHKMFDLKPKIREVQHSRLLMLSKSFIGCKQPGHVDGFSKRACFLKPVDVVASSSSLMVLELGNLIMRKVNVAEGLVSSFAPLKLAKKKGQQMPTIDFPSGVCFSADMQHLYAVDINVGNVVDIEMQSGMANLLFKQTFFKRKLQMMSGCICDEAGNMYLSYMTGIVAVHLKSKKKLWIGSVSRTGYKDGPFEKALFNQPSGMCFLNEATLLVADTANHVIRAIDLKTSNVTTFCGTNAKNEEDEVRDGSLSSACFYLPRRIATANKLVFVTENNHNIRVISTEQQTVTTLELNLAVPAGICAFKSLENNGEESTSKASTPSSDHSAALELPSDRITLFITDMEEHVIHRVDLSSE